MCIHIHTHTHTHIYIAFHLHFVCQHCVGNLILKLKSLNSEVEKHLCVVKAVLHGKNTWDCPVELFEALGDCPLVPSSYKLCTGIQNWKSINSLHLAVDIVCPLIVTLVAINQHCMGEDRYRTDGLSGAYRGVRVNSAPNFTAGLKSA